MAIKQNKDAECRLAADTIRERLWDGRVVDEWEFYDRLMLYQQLELLTGIPPRRLHKG